MILTKHQKKHLKTQNLKSFQNQIYFFRNFQDKKKNTLYSNSSHHMKKFDTKIDYFSSQNSNQQQLSLYTRIRQVPLSHPTRKRIEK